MWWWWGCGSEAVVPVAATVAFEVVAPARILEGDPIPLDLAFTAPAVDTWRLDAATYDRGGRLTLDRYHLEPAAPDPLADWYDTGPMSFGGLRRMPVLGAATEHVTVNLAEHVRLAPGRYQLVVETDRVESDAGPTTLSSPPVRLVVEARTPDQEAAEVAAASRTLTGAGTEENAVSAARTLRFRTSEAALRAMVAHLGTSRVPGVGHQLLFGVVGSPHRALALALVEAVIADPSRPVDADLLHLLAVLRTPAVAPLAPYPDDPAAQQVWHQEVDARRARRAAAVQDAYTLLEAALPRKVGAARAACLQALDSAAHSAGAPVSAELRAKFPTLPADERQRLLSAEWLRLADPTLAPVLAAMIEDPGTTEPLLGTALGRLGALDPDLAATLAARHWERSGTGFRDGWFSLPQEVLPAFDAALAGRLSRPDDRTAYFVERYATAALASEAESVLIGDPAAWSEDHVSALIPYLLRVSPGVGVQKLEAAFGTVELARRRARLLDGIAARQGSPAIEQLAVRLLDHPSPEVADEMARLLSTHGSASAADALFARLEAFHRQWKGRAAALVPSRVRDNPNQAQVQLESRLLDALTCSPAWRLDQVGAERLRTLVVTEEGARRAAHYQPAPEPGVLAWLSWSGEVSLRVDGCALRDLAQLRAKLAQYPTGTAFHVETMVGGVPPQDELLAEVRGLVEAAGHEVRPTQR
jgi:hypothetical protein